MYRVTHPVSGVVIECDDLDDVVLLVNELSGTKDSKPEDADPVEPKFIGMSKTSNFSNVVTFLTKLEKGDGDSKGMKFPISGACKSVRHIVDNSFRNLRYEDVYVKVSTGKFVAGPRISWVLDCLIPTRKRGDS